MVIVELRTIMPVILLKQYIGQEKYEDVKEQLMRQCYGMGMY